MLTLAEQVVAALQDTLPLDEGLALILTDGSCLIINIPGDKPVTIDTGVWSIIPFQETIQ